MYHMYTSIDIDFWKSKKHVTGSISTRIDFELQYLMCDSLLESKIPVQNKSLEKIQIFIFIASNSVEK